ncbi:hypothetical protein LP092_15030 (plasmid) [Moraxella bovis]|uniref:Uncharacterized protein n=1 Tax=Moraxella bovis TaxID=476 RepID=A0ABY6MB90_MORBO|nr:hypothetical protein [Moraxella bovis]UZA04790.1 hypothetical protein LP092_15030 [Moraxella bovis]
MTSIALTDNVELNFEYKDGGEYEVFLNDVYIFTIYDGNSSKDVQSELIADLTALFQKYAI